MKPYQYILFLAGLSGAVAVILGAFGAHALRDNPAVNISVYQTGITCYKRDSSLISAMIN